MSLCVCFLQWITVSVHGAMELDFVLYASKCEYWVSMYENMQQTVYTTYNFNRVRAVLLLLPLFGFGFVCLSVVRFGWLADCLLCLWYAKYDVFSHLLALRLFKCVGGFGTSFSTDFSKKKNNKRNITTFQTVFPPIQWQWKRATFSSEWIKWFVLFYAFELSANRAIIILSNWPTCTLNG